MCYQRREVGERFAKIREVGIFLQDEGLSCKAENRNFEEAPLVDVDTSGRD